MRRNWRSSFEVKRYIGDEECSSLNVLGKRERANNAGKREKSDEKSLFPRLQLDAGRKMQRRRTVTDLGEEVLLRGRGRTIQTRE